MTAKVIQMRDFKRREEREAADVRLAKQVMGLDDPVSRHNAAILERIQGIPANVPMAGAVVGGDDPNVYDTAPCEMPPVWPSFEAPEQDPA